MNVPAVSRKAKLLVSTAVLVALAITGTATAATPAWAWWLPAKANTAVVHANPQGILFSDHETKIDSATCLGVRPARVVKRKRLFHVFRCTITYEDLSSGSSEATWPFSFYFVTSSSARSGVACWDRSLPRLKAKRCV